MRIGLLSDTHGYLDPVIFEHFAECDEVWHAGDFGSMDVLEQLRAFKPVRGVYGNVDSAELRQEVPHDLVWDCAGMKVLMTHIGGYPSHYDRFAKPLLTLHKPDLFLCGHSHILRVARDPALSLFYMNPGACGHHGWHKVRTLLRFTVSDAKIYECHAIELGPRGTVKARPSRHG